MNFIYDGTDDVKYEDINIIIVDGNFNIMSRVIYKGIILVLLIPKTHHVMVIIL